MTSEPGLVWQTIRGNWPQVSPRGSGLSKNQVGVSRALGKEAGAFGPGEGLRERSQSPQQTSAQPTPPLRRPLPTAPGHARRRHSRAAVFSEDCANGYHRWVGYTTTGSYFPVLQGVGPTGLIWIGSIHYLHPRGSRREAVSHSSPASRGALWPSWLVAPSSVFKAGGTL